jgi:hypothetical protein
MVQDPKIQNQQGALKLGSQLPEATLAPECQAGSNNTAGSQPPEVNSGPNDLEAVAARPPLRHFQVSGATSPRGLSPWR